MKNNRLLVILFLFLTSCFGSKKQKKDSIVLGFDELYIEAKTNLLKEEFNFAGTKFEKIEGLFPFTKDGNKAIIMAAYSYYKGNKFDDSLRIIDYYKKINFDKNDLEYIYFLEIMNYKSKVKKFRKDLQLQKNSLKIIEEMNLNFPNSKYLNYVNDSKEYILDLIISNELKIIEFYVQNNNAIGVLNHLKILENNYLLNKKFSGEVNYRFFELYKHFGYKEGILKYYNLLKKYDGESKWYKYADNKL